MPDAPGPEGGYLPAEDVPSTAEGGLVAATVPLPGRRTYQGPAGHNPYFPFGGKKKNSNRRCRSAVLPRPGPASARIED